MIKISFDNNKFFFKNNWYNISIFLCNDIIHYYFDFNITESKKQNIAELIFHI